MFDKRDQDKGVDFVWEVLTIEVPAERIWKEVFYILALMLLASIWFLQKSRIRKQEEMA